MSSFVFGFQDIDKTRLKVVGGKGANLVELTKIEGILVPDGFCISTEAFKRIIGQRSSVNKLIDQLSLLRVDDLDKMIWEIINDSKIRWPKRDLFLYNGNQ